MRKRSCLWLPDGSKQIQRNRIRREGPVRKCRSLNDYGGRRKIHWAESLMTGEVTRLMDLPLK